MISPRFSEQSSRSGSSNNDTALTSATDEGFGRIDSAFSPNAVGSKPRRRSSAMAGEGFGGPYVHASRLREISLDQIVNKALLAKYTEKMVAEWRDIALYGTVLLGANVAFLAIQTVDVTPEDGHTRTSAQRASYFSVLASLGTIISSLVLLILVRHREVMGDGLIQRRSQSRWGLEALALMYGTPFSLVIWAILGFFGAFAFLWFESGDKVVVGIVVVCLISFAIFLGWAISASYCEEDPYEWLYMTVVDTIGRAFQALKRTEQPQTQHTDVEKRL